MVERVSNGQNKVGAVGAGSPLKSADAHIMLCDDDDELRRLLTSLLRDNSYRVTPLADGREVARHLANTVVDLLILDIMLPGIDGLQICRDLRASSTIPILLLTAKDSETERIVGLEMGADDYVSKPFSPPELLARIKAIIRRSRMSNSEDATIESNKRSICFDKWSLDTLRHELRNPEGVIIDLSAGEYDLLLTFLEAPHRVLDREYLIEATRDKTSSGFDRSIDVQISRLRRKIDTSETGNSQIKTVRGVGYKFVAEVKRQ